MGGGIKPDAFLKMAARINQSVSREMKRRESTDLCVGSEEAITVASTNKEEEEDTAATTSSEKSEKSEPERSFETAVTSLSERLNQARDAASSAARRSPRRGN